MPCKQRETRDLACVINELSCIESSEPYAMSAGTHYHGGIVSKVLFCESFFARGQRTQEILNLPTVPLGERGGGFGRDVRQ